MEETRRLQWNMEEFDRLSVYYESAWGEDEWLGFPLDKVSPLVIELVMEAIMDDDVEEVMQLWDGILWD